MVPNPCGCCGLVPACPSPPKRQLRFSQRTISLTSEEAACPTSAYHCRMCQPSPSVDHQTLRHCSIPGVRPASPVDIDVVIFVLSSLRRAAAASWRAAQGAHCLAGEGRRWGQGCTIRAERWAVGVGLAIPCRGITCALAVCEGQHHVQ